MKPWHRFYFINGILSYLMGPLILFLALLGFVRAAGEVGSEWQSGVSLRFLGFLLLLIGLPKLLGLIRLYGIVQKQGRSSFASSVRRALREITSSISELAISILIAPLLFYLHLRFVIEVLLGQSVIWKEQKRGATESILWREAFRVFWVPTFAGLCWFATAMALCPHYLPMLALILIGWIFSIPLAVLTSNPRLGTFLAQLGLYESCLTSEERSELGSLPNSLEQPLPMIEADTVSVTRSIEQV